MKKIMANGSKLRAELRETLLQRFPALRPPAAPVMIDRHAIILGRDSAENPLSLPVSARLPHMHIVGTTGGGKTRLIQHCACQDIVQGRGVCIVDPHGSHPGSLYASMIAWLSKRKIDKSRTIHLIDPNAGTHITGFNPLSLPSADYEPPVIAEAMQQALERVWGEEDMNTKPTMQRVLAALLTMLVELKLTLAEINLFFDPDDSLGVRAWAMKELKNEDARDELAWLHAIASDARGAQDFRQEVMGPRNRLAKITRNESIKLAVSQDANGIDFRAALDDGHIILANLSPGPRAGDQAVQMLGRLLTRSIFFHTVRRHRPERPFFLYLDECQLYLSGDVSRMLAETRKYGTGVVLAHQTLAQLRAAGEDMLDAVKSTTNIKIVTQVKDPAEAAELADMVVRHNLEMPVSVLTKPTVVGYELVRRNSGSESEQTAITESSADTVGETVTVSESHTRSDSETESESLGIADSESWGSSEGLSSSTSESVATGNASTINVVPGDILALPASASGNTLGESAGTFSDTGLASPTRYLLGSARMEPAIVSGVSIGQSRQQSSARGSTAQSGSNRSQGRTTSSQQGVSRTRSDAWTEGVAYSSSKSTTTGVSHTSGHGTSRGWSETLEPILSDRPTSVHSLQSMKYMAGELLRSFPPGRAAISFVDDSGLKTAVLQIAHVADCNMTPAQIDRLREEMFKRSPSAVPIETARAALKTRQSRILRLASELRDAEPEAPQQFRAKRKRKGPEKSVDVHGEKSPPEPPPVKGPDRRRRRP
jgi:hypothetical protein